MARRKTGPGRRTKADREFVSEAEEILEVLRGGIADLSEGVDTPDDVDPQLVNALFRSAHSLKALAGLFRFEPIEELSHRLEDVLDGLRLGRIALSRGLLALLDEVSALFASALEHVGDDAAVAEAASRVDALVARIQAAMNAEPAHDDDLGALGIDPGLRRALTEYEEHRLRESLRRGRHIALVEVPFELSAFEEGLSELQAAVRESGEVLSTLPAPGESPESQICFRLLVASDLPLDALTGRLDFPSLTAHSVRQGRAADAAPAAAAAPAGADAAPAGDEPAAPRAETLESLKSLSETVRVDIRKLDELMNLVGELAIQRTAIGELIARLAANPDTARVGDEFAKLHKGLDRKLRDLQTAVLDVRMVPLRQVFEKVSRVVRRMRRDLGKQVELEIRGADTELDKLIVEALIDPLMHVVRNALDHAIEPPDERLALGKEPVGRIAIEAFGRGSHVVVAVRDDGRGIDGQVLRARAERQGIVAPGTQLSERETLELIFAAGVSTRDEVTETSGRGVGMDVVRANLSALGGVVDVESERGRGTTISMTLPITLAIVQSLIVGVRGQRFAIPLNAVLETLVVDSSAVQRSEGRELLNLRGDALGLRRLADDFGLGASPASERCFVIVMGMGGQRVGVVVDSLEGQRDTVVKPILGPVAHVRGIAGATELGDQTPVLVLDASALIEDAGRRREAA